MNSFFPCCDLFFIHRQITRRGDRGQWGKTLPNKGSSFHPETQRKSRSPFFLTLGSSGLGVRPVVWTDHSRVSILSIPSIASTLSIPYVLFVLSVPFKPPGRSMPSAYPPAASTLSTKSTLLMSSVTSFILFPPPVRPVRSAGATPRRTPVHSVLHVPLSAGPCPSPSDRRRQRRRLGRLA